MTVESDQKTETRGRKKLTELIVLHGTITYKGEDYPQGDYLKVKEQEAEELISMGVACRADHVSNS